MASNCFDSRPCRVGLCHSPGFGVGTDTMQTTHNNIPLPQTDAELRRLADSIHGRIMAERMKAKAAADTTPAPVVPAAPEKPQGATTRHYKFGLLLACAKAGVDGIALVGPAGTGKTTAARMVAENLQRSFEAVSFGPTTSKADLFGYKDAGGTYHDTGLVRAATKGGVFLGDELDAGHPGVAVGMNMVLANPVFSTPVGMVTKHQDFIGIVGMNTYGTGANRQYVGRNQLDAATLDRFVVIEWDLDPAMEAMMVGVTIQGPKCAIGAGGGMTAAQWLARITAVRAAVNELGIRHIVSPRATLNGVKLFKVGVGRTWVEELVLWKGLDADSRAKVERKAGAL